MAIHIDETGRPLIILRESDGPARRLIGLEATRGNILAAKSLHEILRTSLGPKGMDKILVSPDGDVLVTNDGATILDNMDISNRVAAALVELSKSQDDEIGDGTTSVVVLAGALLVEAETLLDRGIHPVHIADGLERAAQIAIKHLTSIAETLEFSHTEPAQLERAARTSLSSKILSRLHDKFAAMAVSAVLRVADLERRDVNFELVKVSGKVGGMLEDSCLVNGIVIDKGFSHPQMPKQVTSPKICLLTCPFEAPKIKTKYQLEIRNAGQYTELHDREQAYFRDMVARLKDAGCTVALCQWGFEDEANHLLLAHGINAIRWVGGPDLELLSIATGSSYVPRFEEVGVATLGDASKIVEHRFGTTGEVYTVVEDCGTHPACTLLIRGGNSIVVDEAVRSMHDAMCVARNLVRDPRVVYGGGACEVSCALQLDAAAAKCSAVDQFSFRAFARALESIPHAIAENAGIPGVDSITAIRKHQRDTGLHVFGVDCLGMEGCADMKKLSVIDTLVGKINQIRLAVQLCRLVLKVDEVIVQT